MKREEMVIGNDRKRERENKGREEEGRKGEEEDGERIGEIKTLK